MNLLKKFRLFPLLVFVFSILFAGAVTSCGQKGDADAKEGTEHPAEDEKAAEHPEGAAEKEHPAETDTTKTEQQ